MPPPYLKGWRAPLRTRTHPPASARAHLPAPPAHLRPPAYAPAWGHFCWIFWQFCTAFSPIFGGFDGSKSPIFGTFLPLSTIFDGIFFHFQKGTAPRRRERCGFGSPKIFLGAKFFEGLPRFDTRKRGYGSKNCKSGANMAVTSPGWWTLTICK